MRGFGRVFKRGSIYWIAYNHRGREHRESAKTENESAARKFLKKRIGEVASGKFIGPSEERLSFEDMADALVTDYEINKLRSLRSLKLSVRHLRGDFALDRAVDVTTDRIKKYITSRQRDGAANASINRELSALKRMFKLAVESGRLRFAPHVPMLEENNARQGFVDHSLFLILLEHLPAYLKDPITFLYLSGWRLGEMRELEWRDVELAGKVVRLRPEISKNKDGRVLPLSGELLEIIERAKTQRRLDCSYVFHLGGEQVGDFKRFVGNGVQEGGRRKSARSRSPPNCGAQHGASGNTRSDRDGTLWTQNSERVRPLQYCQRVGSCAGYSAPPGPSQYL
ncbi:MAG: tyrosine-type recombinase/integrase [Deltaproteobacteria bacterium]|nr:tyrosine-type recombinase/integrase [Deltaproteobacteria bacterium]